MAFHGVTFLILALLGSVGYYFCVNNECDLTCGAKYSSGFCRFAAAFPCCQIKKGINDDRHLSKLDRALEDMFEVEEKRLETQRVAFETKSKRDQLAQDEKREQDMLKMIEKETLFSKRKPALNPETFNIKHILDDKKLYKKQCELGINPCADVCPVSKPVSKPCQAEPLCPGTPLPPVPCPAAQVTSAPKPCPVPLKPCSASSPPCPPKLDPTLTVAATSPAPVKPATCTPAPVVAKQCLPELTCVSPTIPIKPKPCPTPLLSCPAEPKCSPRSANSCPVAVRPCPASTQPDSSPKRSYSSKSQSSSDTSKTCANLLQKCSSSPSTQCSSSGAKQTFGCARDWCPKKIASCFSCKSKTPTVPEKSCRRQKYVKKSHFCIDWDNLHIKMQGIRNPICPLRKKCEARKKGCDPCST